MNSVKLKHDQHLNQCPHSHDLHLITNNHFKLKVVSIILHLY